MVRMNGALFFLLLFVGAPLLELYVLIEVGSEIGALPTILLSIFTALLGAALVRYQGVGVLFRVHESLDRGEAPAIEMMEGAILMLTGVLLLLPGFITDFFGFLALIPPLRRAFIIYFLKHSGALHPAGTPGSHEESVTRVEIIEGKFHREDD